MTIRIEEDDQREISSTAREKMESWEQAGKRQFPDGGGLGMVTMKDERGSSQGNTFLLSAKEELKSIPQRRNALRERRQMEVLGECEICRVTIQRRWR
jgi:hypothetical protein